jgi:ABC-type branched-subunit amino acid transport system substrate-binding protein
MKIWKVFIILVLSSGFAAAQNASSREWTIFHKGLAEYNNGNYDMARQSFSLMISKLPNSQLSTINHLMLAKTNYKTADYQVSLQQCEEFKKLFPNSSYMDDINYLTGNNYYRLNRLETAVVTWLNTGFETTDKKLQEKVFNLADDAIRYKLNTAGVEKLSRENNRDKISEAFKFHLADMAFRTGNPDQARELMQEVEKNALTRHYKEKAKSSLQQITTEYKSGRQIAVLLPLSGANESVGKALLLGFEHAVNEYNKIASEKLSLIKYDYASDLVTALEQIKRISSNPSVIAVFGPVENEIVASCGVVAEYEGLTLLSPTATLDKILSISENTILLAPTVKVMARKIQTLILDSLKINRVATFSPIDEYYINFTDEFVQAHMENGGQIAAQEWYYPGDQNYKKQFTKMKRIGLRLEFQDSLVTKIPEISESKIDSLYKLYQAEQLELLKETKVKVDTSDIPVEAFDGMFIPVYETDISYVAPQFAYSHIKTQLIGNADWYNPDALKKNRNYINGIIFVTDGYLNEEDWDYRQFRNNIRNIYKKTPEKFELIAYDCFNFIAPVFKGNPKITKTEFAGKVVQLKPYHGIYRSFEVDNERKNKSARILKYIYGQIIPVR